ncbi:cytochrome P450 10-like [Glandiceps talaboti]
MKQIKQEDGEIPNFQSEIYKWSLESIFKVVFDERLGCLYSDIESNYEAKEVFQAAGDFFRTLNKLLLGVPFYKLFNTLEWKKFLHYEEVFYRTSKKYIDLSIARMQELSEKKEIAGEANFLESLLGREDLTYQEMVAVPGDMMLGAIDTTGNALVFNLYTLATNQDKQAKLYDEIINVIGSEGAITSNELDKMVYLKGCIKETSRVFPVASANSRTTTTDMILSGYQVPAGTTVRTQSIAGWLPEYVSEPEKFIPERWIRSDKRREDIHPYVVLPFGFGPRMCMGKRLAEQSLQVVITRLVQNFRIEWHYGEMNMVTRLTQAPGRPASFTFMNRK